MFGLFSRNKSEKKELAEMEAQGAAQSSDPFLRRRYSRLYQQVHGDVEALPLFDAIAADFPGSVRESFIAANIRLESRDPAGVAQMESVARARQSLAIPAWGGLSRYFEAIGDQAEWERVQPLFVEAVEREALSTEQRTFEDAGGPLEPHQYTEEQLAFFRSRLAGTENLYLLLAGSRLLDDGTRQQVLVYDSTGNGEDLLAVPMTADILGDFVLYSPAQRYWLEDELKEIEGSQIYP